MTAITVIIETPGYTSGKYVFDPGYPCYRLKKNLPLGMHFPYDFGMIGNTMADDHDPADEKVLRNVEDIRVYGWCAE